MTFDDVILLTVRVLGYGIVLAAALLVNGWVWRRLWSDVNDWRMFVGYVLWRMRNGQRYRNKKKHASTLRHWARQIEESDSDVTEEKGGGAC